MILGSLKISMMKCHYFWMSKYLLRTLKQIIIKKPLSFLFSGLISGHLSSPVYLHRLFTASDRSYSILSVIYQRSNKAWATAGVLSLRCLIRILRQECLTSVIIMGVLPPSGSLVRGHWEVLGSFLGSFLVHIILLIYEKHTTFHPHFPIFLGCLHKQ